MKESLDVGSEIVAGCKDVFSTMLMVELEAEEVVIQKKVAIKSNITSMIGLGGGLKGLLAVHCPALVATEITGTFLGMDVEEIDDDVKDAIGEIANMIAGNLKISFAKTDTKIELAIPTSIVGDSFYVSGIADSTRIVVPFRMGEGKFWVELMYIMNT
ncbi:MAG: chemotaxis protein CheX [Desulfotalea sp.]|nr:MAG: chemotaxis protein CheX [Desulfotalea sp.]